MAVAWPEGCNGAFAPPNLDCCALGGIQSWLLIYKNFNFKGFLVKNIQLQPPNRISGYEINVWPTPEMF